ncbi:hypothetical protein KRR55_07585 [Paeniglutamicibacter sp. ABSL32-1]|uniref:hypothetical protein n=1 Tax=Paeniglutamicibacter quisquiliarum TaxID=2849498 RepID=UPI001C2D270A|nr:hypothetical protein [Paeniglutamicibacter quisquiliarum]MBV1778970.1 hypothetical protein [Paeniglutamicibacter quisquiliarum]
MSISKTPLDSRIFATQPAARHALAVELRRNRRAATTCVPSLSTRPGAHSPLPGQRRQDGALHPDLAAGSTGGQPGTRPATMTN